MSEESQSNTMYLRELINGGLILHPEMAIQLAEIYLSYAYGEESLDGQRPLTATERDGKWFVAGSYIKGIGTDDDGRALVILDKKNGRVLECAIPKFMAAPFRDPRK